MDRTVLVVALHKWKSATMRASVPPPSPTDEPICITTGRWMAPLCRLLEPAGE